MPRIRRNLLIFLGLFTLFGAISISGQQSERIGPEKGWLILHGGGIMSDRRVMERFVSLAGGKDSSIVVVLTAAEPGVFTPDILKKYREWWLNEFGVSHVEMIDTRDRKQADMEAFVAPLRKASGVWILGGRLKYVVDSYLGTRTQLEIEAVVERGGVIGGASAGAMIQGSFLLNVTKVASGEPLPHSKMYLDMANSQGFGLLKNTTIYPHFSTRDADKDVAEVAKRYPDLTAIGIDEDTAIVFHDDQFEVIGSGKVFVLRRKKEKTVLENGQKFDLKTFSRIN
jgi:cyanophycinase